jgi:DNA-binding CsgD family transcriptional regulator
LAVTAHTFEVPFGQEPSVSLMLAPSIWRPSLTSLSYCFVSRLDWPWRVYFEKGLPLSLLVYEELRPRVGTKLDTCRGRELRALPARLKQVLDLLLLGHSDKEIAARCDLAQPTAREYITTIYRRYGASSRAHLLASFRRSPFWPRPPQDRQ